MRALACPAAVLMFVAVGAFRGFKDTKYAACPCPNNFQTIAFYTYQIAIEPNLKQFRSSLSCLVLPASTLTAAGVGKIVECLCRTYTAIFVLQFLWDMQLMLLDASLLH